MSTDASTEQERIRTLAQSVDCMTEDDLNLLTKTTPGTTESWRKRGKGPNYILAGNRVLYPRAEVERFLRSKLRESRDARVSEGAL